MEDTEEVWKEIPDFPRYAVSNLGNVMNIKKEKLVKPQATPQGQIYVPLYGSSRGFTRSVKVLVANAFLDYEDYDVEVFDTPINKDGDKRNNNVDNLAWRPLWFAVKYSRQFSVGHNINTDVGPVYDLGTNLEYDNVYIVGVTFGLLFRDVYRSTYAETPVFPTNQIFRIPNSIHVR
jgi:hypothetical protein